MNKVENHENLEVAIITSNDYNRIIKHISNLRELTNKGLPSSVGKLLSELLSYLSMLEHYKHLNGTDLDAPDNLQPYFIRKKEFQEIARNIEILFRRIDSRIAGGQLREEVFRLRKTWESIEKKNGGNWDPTLDRVTGLINQLVTRQDEINVQAKQAVDELKERTNSATANLERHLLRQSNQLKINANEIQSEVLSQIETAASDAKIHIKDESSKLWRELTEDINVTINSALDKKQKEIHDRTERKSNLLLEKVQSDVSSLSDKVNEQVEDFCVLNEALRKTLSFVASDALSDTSIKQAEQEKKTADTLRGWGVAWLVVSIGLFLITFDYDKLIDGNNVPQYTLILLRSFFLIVGITPGFYLLRESARHRTDERRYRQKGIQLATIDGYFAEFDDSERNSVKKDLSKHYFHGAEHFVDSSSVDNVQSKYDKVFDKVLSSKKYK